MNKHEQLDQLQAALEAAQARIAELETRLSVDYTHQLNSPQHLIEDQLGLVLQAAGVGLWDWDLLTNQVYYSPEWKRQIGYEADEISNDFSEWQKRVHPDDIEHALETVRSYLVDPYPNYHLEFRFRHKDGSYRWILTQASLKFDGQGKPIRMLGSHIDITERKKVEDALRESETRYREVFENSLDCLYLLEVTDDGRFRNLEINLALEQSVGISRHQLIGKTQEETVSEETAQLVNAKYRRCVELGVPIGEEAVLDLPTGQRAYQSTLIPLYNETGRVYRLIGISHDVTEQKQAAEALLEKERQFRLLAENSTDMISRHSPDGVYWYASPACRVLLGYEPEDLIGHSAYEFIHPDDAPDVNRSHTTILDQPIVYTVAYRIRRKDGEYIWFETTSKTIHDNQSGEITEIHAASRDITDRKRAEDNLKRYSQRLSILREIDRSILLAYPPPIVSRIVLEHLIQLIPYDWAGIMLYSDDVPELKTIAFQQVPNVNFYVEIQNLVLRNSVIDQLKSGHTVLTEDMQMGEGLHTNLAEQLIAQGFHACLTVPMIAQNQLIGVVQMASLQIGFFTLDHQQIAEEVAGQIAIALHQAALHDQIARHNLELGERVRERTHQLENLNRELESFSYSVSHDLRSPLRAIQSFSEIIARRYRDELSEEGRRYFDNIIVASEQMNQLITDLLDYARLGRQRIHLQLIPLEIIFPEVIANLSPEIEATQAEIYVAEALPSVYGNATLLKRIFSNLLQNALIYHQPNRPPQIDVSFVTEADDIVIQVKDQGIGISEEFHEKIFNIFLRLHSQDQYPGTGIGLAIVRKSVELLNGTVWLESVINKGSTFFIRLPRTEQ